MSPQLLASHAIPVVRVVHNPREFVVVYPGAYHRWVRVRVRVRVRCEKGLGCTSGRRRRGGWPGVTACLVWHRQP